MFKNIVLSLFLDKKIKEEISFLKTIDIFKDFSISQLKQLTTILYKRIYEKKEIVYKKGEEAKLICILKSGKVKLANDNETKQITTSLLFERNILFNTTAQYGYDAVPLEKSEIYLIHKDDMESLMHKNTDIGFKVAKQLLERIFNKA